MHENDVKDDILLKKVKARVVEVVDSRKRIITYDDNSTISDECLAVSDIEDEDVCLPHKYSLRVGDKIKYRQLNVGNLPRPTVEEVVTRIGSPNFLSDVLPTVTTTGGMLDEMWNSNFEMVKSANCDAPPIGMKTSLDKVNLISGKLVDNDNMASQIRTRRRKARDTIADTIGGEMAVLAVATLRASKICAKQKRR